MNPAHTSYKDWLFSFSVLNGCKLDIHCVPVVRHYGFVMHPSHLVFVLGPGCERDMPSAALCSCFDHLMMMQMCAMWCCVQMLKGTFCIEIGV